jgi:hypothetical protein
MLKIITDYFGGHSAISPKLFKFVCLLQCRFYCRRRFSYSGAHYSGLLPSALRVITKVMLKIIPDDFGGHSAISPKLFNFDCLLNPSIKA